MRPLLLIAALLLGSAPLYAATRVHVPLFLSTNAPQQSFVRIIWKNSTCNNSTLEATIRAYDDIGNEYGPIELSGLSRCVRVVTFNSHDLENGNRSKHIPEGIGGIPEGNWRLVIESPQDIEVGSYVRTSDGFLTNIGAVVPPGYSSHRQGYIVTTFNPGRNMQQVSRLRIINPTDTRSIIFIEGFGDDGERHTFMDGVDVPARSAITITATELEQERNKGDLPGKRRLAVVPYRGATELMVMSLVETPTGHLSNLSTQAAQTEIKTRYVSTRDTFDVDLVFVGDVIPEYQRAAFKAKEIWEQVLRSGLPDKTLDISTSRCFENKRFNTTVDDLVVFIFQRTLEQPAVARAAPCVYSINRHSDGEKSFEARAGYIQIDPFYKFYSGEQLTNTMMHEIGHILGFSKFTFSIVDKYNDEYPSFMGAGAMRQYENSDYRKPLGVEGVPLDDDGSHLAEGVFDTGRERPVMMAVSGHYLSNVTLGVLADLGYSVSYDTGITKHAVIRSQLIYSELEPVH